MSVPGLSGAQRGDAFVLLSSARKVIFAMRRIPKTFCLTEKMRSGDSSLDRPGKLLSYTAIECVRTEANSSKRDLPKWFQRAWYPQGVNSFQTGKRF